MLENILMQLMDLQGYCIRRAGLEQGKLHLWVEPRPRRWTCPLCGQFTDALHGQDDVALRERPILGVPVILHVPHFRIRCACHRQPVTLDLWMREPGFLVTRALADMVHHWARDIAIKPVAQRLGLHWNTARDIDKARLTQAIESAEPLAPNSIGVDEIAYARGHKYLTIVTDQSNRRICGLAVGRRAENLQEILEKRLDPMARKHLEAASIDMWDPYEKALKQAAPHAMIVYDKFHLIRMANDCVDQVRRHIQRQLGAEGKRLIKHKRYILLKGQERLRPDQQQSLDELLAANAPLESAYLLKEQLRQLYSIEPDEGDTPQSYFQKAFAYLVGWIERAENSGLKPFAALVGRIKRRWNGVLNYFRYPISNGLSEGLNNKIASLIKRSYGLRNLEYFMLKIYQQGNFI